MPVLLSRNPFLLVEMLVIVLTLRVLVPVSGNWRWMIRLALVFVAISVLFNLVTVHSGDRVIGRLPGNWPIVGGDLTWNALVYGVFSGLAILLMVLVWTLVAANLHWTDLMRHVPARLAPLAVAGSVAWSYLPRMQETLVDIRESQRSRGWQANRVRDLPAIVVPLLAGGLDRALVTAEVLETRGFGGQPVRQQRMAPAARLLAGLIALVTAAYCLLTGQEWAGLGLGMAGLLMLAIELRQPPETPPASRWRISRLQRADWMCLIASGVSLLGLTGRMVTNESAFAFNPYPELTVPVADPVAMLFVLLLFAPVIAAPERQS